MVTSVVLSITVNQCSNMWGLAFYWHVENTFMSTSFHP